ncbi:hypothetical protein M9H77_30381 [Catharanthus roseus]|uniref:Uncharacterized protein n=1 Tax=Catharanthus roseus TaxID=4058 RepID=A0ACB9ZXX7_CATRO|nr:hypothetical protein M9H77_30381 [Catharanthus roseus]
MENDANRLDLQEHQGVVTRAKAKQLKSHKDQIQQKKFQGLNFYIIPHQKTYEDLNLINLTLRGKTLFKFDRKNLEETKASKPQLQKQEDLRSIETKNKNSKTQSTKGIRMIN